MPEHVHLLFSEPERGNPSLVLAALKQTFAHWLLRELRAKTGAHTDALWCTPVAAGIAFCDAVGIEALSRNRASTLHHVQL